jgi:hypothetical protein
VSYELAYGAIPDGLQLHHTCGVRLCVNPSHLIALTVEAHARRPFDETARCKQGHLRTPENTYVSPSGVRSCRLCKVESAKQSMRSRSGNRANGILMPPPASCPHGHPYPQYLSYRPSGYYCCKECTRLRAQRRKVAAKQP